MHAQLLYRILIMNDYDKIAMEQFAITYEQKITFTFEGYEDGQFVDAHNLVDIVMLMATSVKR